MKIPNIGIEEKIQEAMANGEFKDLPGAGKPIELDDDSFVPNEMKMAHRVLKNANMVPKEVTMMQEIELLKNQLLDQALSEPEKLKIQTTIAIKQSAVNIALERMQRK
jgi:hypothetical protein